MNKSITVKKYSDHTDIEVWDADNVIRVNKGGGVKVSIQDGLFLSQNGVQTLIDALQHAVSLEQDYHAEWEAQQAGEYLVGTDD